MLKRQAILEQLLGCHTDQGLMLHLDLLDHRQDQGATQALPPLLTL